MVFVFVRLLVCSFAGLRVVCLFACYFVGVCLLGCVRARVCLVGSLLDIF